MLLQKLKIVLIPSNASEVKRYAIPHIIWVTTVLFLLASVVLLGWLIWQFKHKIVDSQQIATLTKENAILEQKTDEFGKQMASLTTTMNEYQNYTERIRRISDILSAYGADSLRIPPVDLPDENLLIDRLDDLLATTQQQKIRLQEIINSLENYPEIWDHTPSIRPTTGISVGPGFEEIRDPFTGKLRMHEGLDISAPTGTPIVATADGEVTFVGQLERYGWVVELDHGHGYETAYGHCSVVRVKEGEKVKRGQVIALVGNSGRSIGPHLHYEVRVNGEKVDPMKYILD